MTDYILEGVDEAQRDRLFCVQAIRCLGAEEFFSTEVKEVYLDACVEISSETGLNAYLRICDKRCRCRL